MLKSIQYALGVLAFAGCANASSLTVNVYNIENTSENQGSSLTFSGAPTMSRTLSAGDHGFYLDWDGPVSPGDVPSGVNILGGFPPQNGQTRFGSDYRGELHVAKGGSYPITFGADDAGYLFIDGALVASTPGSHGIYFVTPIVSLAAGSHKFDIQSANWVCCKAIVAFYTPAGVTLAAPPAAHPRHMRHKRHM